MSVVAANVHTPADLLAMPDSANVELVDGQLVEKPESVLSSMVETILLWLVAGHCFSRKLGVVLSSANGIQCFADEPNKVRKPDASFIKHDRFRREHLREGFLSIAPDWIGEVISTHDEAADLNEKVEEYLAAGVALVWVIDPLNGIVIVHRADGSVTKLHKNDELSGEDVIVDFRCQVADLFPAEPKA